MAAVFILLTVLNCATAFAQERKTVLMVSTATPGGGFPVYGEVFAEIINRYEPRLEVRPRYAKGSIENVALLETEKVDIGLVQGEVVQERLAGENAGESYLKIVTTMYATPGMFVVPGDSPYRSIRSLVGRPVAFGARGSGSVILARKVLEGTGLGPSLRQ